MTTLERVMPPLNSDERATLDGRLDFYRATLEMKCKDLCEDQLRQASAAPSPLTLLGLVQHMAEAQRNWFRRVLAEEHATPIYSPDADLGSPDGGFDLAAGATYEAAVATWHAEISNARETCGGRELDDTSPFMGAEVTLRWIYVHLIGEYARHIGHADLVRERIDGRTGV